MIPDAMLRIALAVLIVIDLSLPRYFRRRHARPSQRSSDRVARLLMPERVFTVAVYCGLLAFVINPRWIAWSHVGLPDGLRAFGIVLSVAGLAGLTDVDAITLSMAGLVRDGGTDAPTGVAAIVVASLMNTLVKCGLIVALGSAGLRRRAMVSTVLLLAAGLAAVAAF